MLVKKASAQNSAFTLVEVIIGVAILSIVMASITVLTIVSIQANQANVNKLTAYYLAQESLEGLRNMRDSNWLQNYGWDRNAAWGSSFEADGYYKIDYLPGQNPPWVLTSFADRTAALAGSSLTRVTDGANMFYVHDASYGTNIDARFNRYIYIVHDSSEEILEATATVFWNDHGRTVEVVVSTQLSDWREGPI